MPKRVPVQAAKQIGQQHGLKQVILVGWDGEKEHVVTWGDTVEACDQAALGGDRVKKALGWPETLQGTAPSRVKRLQARVSKLEKELAEMRQPKDTTSGWAEGLRKEREQASKERGR